MFLSGSVISKFHQSDWKKHFYVTPHYQMEHNAKLDLQNCLRARLLTLHSILHVRKCGAYEYTQVGDNELKRTM